LASKIRFLLAAQRDLEEAGLWYEARSRGLGLEFISAVEDRLAFITDHPLAFSEAMPGVRRALTKRFPYAVYYRPETDRIVVLAVLHCSRSPHVWRRRARRKSS